MLKRVERPVLAGMVEKTKAKAKGRTKKGKSKGKSRTKGKEKAKTRARRRRKERVLDLQAVMGAPPLLETEGIAAAMTLRASGDVRALSFCLPETEDPERSHVSLDRSRYCLGPF